MIVIMALCSSVCRLVGVVVPGGGGVAESD